MACPNASSAGRVLQRNPMRRIRSRWACTPNGQSIGGIAAAPPIIFMQSRRRIAVPARRPRCSAFNFHHQNRKLPAAKRGSMPNVHCRNPERRMSQMGQTLTSADVCGTTASPSEADMTRSPLDVAEVPTADSCSAARTALAIPPLLPSPEFLQCLEDCSNEVLESRLRQTELAADLLVAL